MAHRIEVELTSKSGDDTWTWRAAGAKQPRGTVEAGLVPADASVGDVLRAELESTLDGPVITGLLPLKTKSGIRARGELQRIEVTGTPRRGADVNVVLASKGRRREERKGDDRKVDGRRRAEGRPTRGAERGPRRDRDHEARGSDDQRRTRRPAAAGSEGRDRRPTGPREPRRPAASTAYRNAALADLKPEELPVAEQLIRGGIPSVRHAIEEQNARARADGRPEVTAAPLLAMAERLLPVVNLATWKDRASVARNAGREVSLRELRSIVAASSTLTLDDEGRKMAEELRSTLDQRVTALRDGWVSRITSALDAGKVLDAVRASVRPPEPAARLSGELAMRLASSAGDAMAPTTPPEEWLAMLQVVIDSPVRRTVKPAGLPEGADEALLAEARKAAGYVPELARLLGIPIPPPPGPRRPVTARPGQQRRAS